MSKPNCGAIVAPCHYPMCLSLDGRCSWPPTMSATERIADAEVMERAKDLLIDSASKLLDERDAARAEVAALRAELAQSRRTSQYWKDEHAAANNELDAKQTEVGMLREALRGVLKWVEDESGSAAGCPTHFHEVAGVWDDDAGALLAGNPCADCAAWDAARAALEHKHG